MPAPSLSHLASPLRPAAAARLVASISRSLVTDPFPGVSSGSARALSVFPAHSTHRRSRSVVTVLGAHSASRLCPTRKVASSPPPPASRSTAATRRPANSHALTRSPSQASLQQKASSSRAAVTPTSPQLAPLPRRPRSPPNSRSADNERPVTPPASDQLPSSFNLDPKRLPRWVKLSLSGVVLLLGGLELTLQSAGRPSLLSYIPSVDLGLERAIDRWFEPSPPPTREELLERDLADRRQAEGHYKEEMPMVL